MANAADIATALLTRAASLSVGSPSLPIAMPEMPFDPAQDASDGKYIEVRLFLNRPAWEGLSEGVLQQGLLQVTAVWPPNVGDIAAILAADEALDHFPKGLPLHSGSAKVKLGQGWVSSPLSDASELRVPVTIPWTAS